jgi:hypothetical protein
VGLACGGGSHSRGGLSWAELPGVSLAQEKPGVWLWPPDVPRLWRGAGEVPNLSKDNLRAGAIVSLAKVTVFKGLLLHSRPVDRPVPPGLQGLFFEPMPCESSVYRYVYTRENFLSDYSTVIRRRVHLCIMSCSSLPFQDPICLLEVKRNTSCQDPVTKTV